ncbi:pyroglutamyl-peptidase 1-like [Ylistrum balloti]|uniref:pyroglutamyl-peptidase 1-like n=1 Tax=Ylistrum balloti TaxID=509963 RepID=UPI002905E892|nr:pyroglutamyl-peptidase 1-like [Ylistrum balloti]XP_060073604.1 pyroglutamyl-peptidase 1-like [Ylistrum balloti]
MPAAASKKTVLVTGFGPFGAHTVNASWVAVQELDKQWNLEGVEISIQEIPVEYDTVHKMIPTLWEEVKPCLVIHVGVSGIASKLTLEQQAHNDGYDKKDVKGTCPERNCCVNGANNCIVSGIDMQKVCDEINDSGIEVKSTVSEDPGRYLCDFSYFLSLNIDRSRSAFIHVPPLDQPYSGKQLAQGLEAAITAMLKQVS